MTTIERELRKQLRDSGISKTTIDALWPAWWSAEAESSLSATTELRYTIARRLGIAPSSLFDGPPRFIWRDQARFKNLGTTSDHEQAVLASFSVSVGRCALAGAPAASYSLVGVSAQELRTSILASSPAVGLDQLLSAAWALGLPTISLALFPLARKRMHAVTTRVGDGYALLIGRKSRFAAQVAYDIAHELGHVALDHVADQVALLDVDDPLRSSNIDSEEEAADRFALELLTGSPEPEIWWNLDDFNGAMLSRAAMDASAATRVDPGVIILCFAHQTGSWGQAIHALRSIPPGPTSIGPYVNEVAAQQFEWARLPRESKDFLRAVMGTE